MCRVSQYNSSKIAKLNIGNSVALRKCPKKLQEFLIWFFLNLEFFPLYMYVLLLQEQLHRNPSTEFNEILLSLTAEFVFW